MANEVISAAKSAKNDEFYTQWPDIEREVNAYLEYDPDVFRNKTILLPCDDPEWSNFTKFFALHFTDFGLKKLISTSYAPASKNLPTDAWSPPLFEVEDPRFDPAKSKSRGKIFTLTRDDITGDGHIDIDDLKWDYLDGDGDFRSDEVVALRDESDAVVTNPPFSLFRELVAWLESCNVKYAVIGNSNAVTYKEVFRLIRNNRLWLGATANTSDMVFAVPKGTAVKESDRDKAKRLGYPPDEQHDYTRLGNSCWFTNIEHGRRHEPVQLLTAAENLKFNKKLIKSLTGRKNYQRYVNLDALEIPYSDAIPSDHDGIMGVPVTWLAKYNPERFEILANLDDHDSLRSIGAQPISEEFIKGYRAAGGTGAQRAGGYWPGLADPNRFPFKRIFIRHLNPEPKKG